MSNNALAVPTGVSRRIEKLAMEAGRTPAQMLKFVLRDGLGQVEHAVKEANSGLEELNAGKGIPVDEVKRRAENRRRQRARSGR